MRRTIGVAAAGLLLAGAADAARTARVTITDSALSPSRVRVDSGGTVTWTNRGARSHRVASRDGSFAPFTLRAGARRAVRFAQTGRHPYSVDGSRCGVVFAGVPLGTGCSGGGASGPPPANGTRFFNYSVLLTGSVKNDGFVKESDGRQSQKWTRTYTWHETFNVRVKVLVQGPVFVALNASGTATRGTVNATEAWRYFYQPNSNFPPNADCEGSVTGSVPGSLIVTASSVGAQFSVWGQTPAGWSRDDVIAADCNSWSPPTTRTADRFAGPLGTTLEPFILNLAVHFERRGGAATRAPVAALLRGNGFTLSSGLHTTEQTTCAGTCSGTLQIEERYTAKFTPRR